MLVMRLNPTCQIQVLHWVLTALLHHCVSSVLNEEGPFNVPSDTWEKKKLSAWLSTSHKTIPST